jgi:hypothetical protein
MDLQKKDKTRGKNVTGFIDELINHLRWIAVRFIPPTAPFCPPGD